MIIFQKQTVTKVNKNSYVNLGSKYEAGKP